jgi:hypothetical protein
LEGKWAQAQGLQSLGFGGAVGEVLFVGHLVDFAELAGDVVAEEDGEEEADE